nr:tripartite tricarboxylate transporter TctB family protein [Salinicola tamaricis]
MNCASSSPPTSRCRWCCSRCSPWAICWPLPALGFIAATALFLLIAQLCLRRGHWLSAVLVTVLITAVIYALFTLLFQVYLP